MDPKAAADKLCRGCLTAVSPEELAKKLGSGRTLRVKFGVDPTSRDLHLGHSVVLRRLRAFQDLGHTVVLIIGDFTAMIGDPSGRDETRPTLAAEEVRGNARTYESQAYLILDRSQTELRFNSEWLKGLVQDGLLGILKRHTVQQVLAREDFKQRLKENSPLTLLEILYPIFQGYDSVAVRADVEFGGNDQLTNLLMGRRMQADAGQEPQVVMTMPLLNGTDGVKKMSKSYGNAIGLTEPARELFGKVMSVSDDLMRTYWELLTDEDPEKIKARHPMDAKKDLARRLVAAYHGEGAGTEELRYFETTFSKRELPTDMKEVVLPRGLSLSELVLRAGGTQSRNEARRLVRQGGVKIDGRKASVDAAVSSPGTFVLQMGRHQFVRIRLEEAPSGKRKGPSGDRGPEAAGGS